jgi:DNA-directed RNA polymerase subunit RPC12/RpoP
MPLLSVTRTYRCLGCRHTYAITELLTDFRPDGSPMRCPNCDRPGLVSVGPVVVGSTSTTLAMDIADRARHGTDSDCRQP